MSNTEDSSLPGPGPASDAAGSPVVNLQVVSPSSQVRSPLTFQLLPATTTVKELKERIRDALDVSPSAESQRLIYRGRMLARDSETMMEILGEETLKTLDQQTFHLVLRPTATGDAPNSTSTPVSSLNSQTERTHNPYAPTPRLSSAENLPPIQPSTTLPRRTDGPQIPPHQPGQPHNDLQHRMLLQRIQARHDELAEQLSHLNRGGMPLNLPSLYNGVQLPPGFQVPAQHPTNAPGNGLHTNAFGQPQFPLPIFQNQQARGLGLQPGPIPNGIPQTTMHQGPPSRTQSPALPHGHAPDQTTTITRHGVNANGERWQITVNESTTVIPPGSSQHRTPSQPRHDLTSTLQNLLQTTERISAMQARLNNLTQRPGGGPPIGNPNPVSTIPQRPSSTPPTGRVARPTPTSISSFPVSATFPIAASSSPPANDSPVVYIMSSPNGPQALLINNSQSFYSQGHSYITQQTVNGTPGEVRNRRDRTHRHRHRHRDMGAPVVIDAGGAPAPAEPARNVNQPVQPLRIAVWPHAWLIVRLLFFIWFFTYNNNSSWSRIFTIWGCALILFIVNTGVFNDVFGAFWNPVRQHLENLLPLAAPNPPMNARLVVPQEEGNAAGAGVAGAPRNEPIPEEIAQRLLEQRRQQDASWVTAQFRRIEHAVLLFIASIVPGTAERHIEARTMEENRLLEERRQQAAAAAAALEPTPAENQEGGATGAATPGEPEVADLNEQGDADIRFDAPAEALAVPAEAL